MFFIKLQQNYLLLGVTHVVVSPNSLCSMQKLPKKPSLCYLTFSVVGYQILLESLYIQSRGKIPMVSIYITVFGELILSKELFIILFVGTFLLLMLRLNWQTL